MCPALQTPHLHTEVLGLPHGDSGVRGVRHTKARTGPDHGGQPSSAVVNDHGGAGTFTRRLEEPSVPQTAPPDHGRVYRWGPEHPVCPRNSCGPDGPANASSGPAVCSHALHFVPTVPRDGWLASFTEEETRGPERTHRLSRVTQPANGRVGNRVQASLWAPTLYPSTVCGVPRSPHACFWRDLLDSVKRSLRSQDHMSSTQTSTEHRPRGDFLGDLALSSDQQRLGPQPPHQGPEGTGPHPSQPPAPAQASRDARAGGLSLVPVADPASSAGRTSSGTCKEREHAWLRLWGGCRKAPPRRLLCCPPFPAALAEPRPCFPRAPPHSSTENKAPDPATTRASP